MRDGVESLGAPLEESPLRLDLARDRQSQEDGTNLQGILLRHHCTFMATSS